MPGYIQVWFVVRPSWSTEALRITVPVGLHSAAQRMETHAMHELSIAHNLVEVASAAAHEAGAVRVSVVRVAIGALAGVVKDALLFSFDVAAAGTPLQGARLEIVDVAVTVFCPTCQVERDLPAPQTMRCPVCHTPTADIRKGRELMVTSIEVDDPDEGTDGA